MADHVEPIQDTVPVEHPNSIAKPMPDEQPIAKPMPDEQQIADYLPLEPTTADSVSLEPTIADSVPLEPAIADSISLEPAIADSVDPTEPMPEEPVENMVNPADQMENREVVEPLVIEGVTVEEIRRHPLYIIGQIDRLLIEFEENYRLNSNHNARRRLGVKLLADLESQSFLLELQAIFSHGPQHQVQSRTLNMTMIDVGEMNIFAPQNRILPEQFRRARHILGDLRRLEWNDMSGVPIPQALTQFEVMDKNYSVAEISDLRRYLRRYFHLSKRNMCNPEIAKVLSILEYLKHYSLILCEAVNIGLARSGRGEEEINRTCMAGKDIQKLFSKLFFVVMANHSSKYNQKIEWLYEELSQKVDNIYFTPHWGGRRKRN